MWNFLKTGLNDFTQCKHRTHQHSITKANLKQKNENEKISIHYS
jgi:hypothetical protein